MHLLSKWGLQKHLQEKGWYWFKGFRNSNRVSGGGLFDGCKSSIKWANLRSWSSQNLFTLALCEESIYRGNENY